MTTPKIDLQELSGSLWCICAYFNPMGVASRKENFQAFYYRMKQQGANLLCAELSLHDRAFQLPELVGDDVVPVRLTSPHMLWQKENLLQLLLRHLPGDCDKVCWIDSDVLYQTDDWQAAMYDALNKFRLVQGFSFAASLPKGVNFVDGIDINSFPTRFDDCAKVYSYLMGLTHPEIKQSNGHPGFSWAARRSLLEEVGFYNESILGGSDLLMSRAATYTHYSPETCEQYSRFQLDSYFEWAKRFGKAVDLSIGYIPNVLFHLWHGSFHKRAYDSRLQTLRNLDYDPSLDLRMQDNGLWDVTDEGTRLLAPARSFFINRNEDGP
jgi:hypothetical protein